MDPQQVLTGAQDAMNARRVFGDPIRVDDVTIVPVAVVGGGGGAGKKNADQAGVGFGVRARAAGVYVVKNGNVSWRPALNVNLIIAGGQLVAIAGLLLLRQLLASRKT